MRRNIAIKALALQAWLARHRQVQRRDFHEAQLGQRQRRDLTASGGGVVGQRFFEQAAAGPGLDAHGAAASVDQLRPRMAVHWRFAAAVIARHGGDRVEQGLVLVVVAALLGQLANATSIETVYRVCAYLPLIGLLKAFLPTIRK